MDRIDIWVTVGAVEYDALSETAPSGTSTNIIKERVRIARDIQGKRLKQATRRIKLNSEMNVKDLNTFAPISKDVKDVLNQSAEKLQLSARAYHRTIKLARTIADIEHSAEIEIPHILEALQYRPKINQ